LIDQDISRLFAPPPDQNKIVQSTYQVMWEHILYDNNLKDYGFYEVGVNRYHNKIQAILDSQLLGKPVRWNYLDEEYDHYDWTQEPTESLPELYAQRAQHLRENYDYLVLHFSGGSDSAQIIETFIDNHIHLDEVLIRGSFDQVERLAPGVFSAQDNYAECLVQSIPLAQWVKDNHMPHLRITLSETSNLIHDYFDRTPNWMEHSGGILTPHFHTKGTPESMAPHYRDLTERGLRVAHIYGADKPRLFRHKNMFYTQWQDTSIMSFNTVRDTDSPNPQYIECFYWGTNAVKLQIKQLHTIKNYVKAHNLPDMMFDPKKAIESGQTPTVAGRSTDNFIASLVYHRTLPLLSEHLKPVATTVIKDMDAWFAQDPNSQAFQNYKKGIDYLGVILPKHSICKGGIWSETGINAMHSKPRYLGT
jgi:hypothetical protein